MAKSHSYGYDFGSMQPVASRTPISFGLILSNVLTRSVPELKQMEQGNNEDFLYFLYRRPLGSGYAFAMFQADRSKGQFTIEVGYGIRRTYPGYRAYVTPDYSVDGVRERLISITQNDDIWWEYSSAQELESVLESAIKEYLNEGIFHLMKHNRERLDSETEKWRERVNFNRAQIENRQIHDIKGLIDSFSERTDMPEILEYMESNYSLRTFDRFYPPFIRHNMRKPEFMTLQLLIMSDVIEQPDTIFNALEKEKFIEYKNDILHLLAGRLDVLNFAEPASSEREECLRYAYFKSMSVMESILGLEDEKKVR